MSRRGRVYFVFRCVNSFVCTMPKIKKSTSSRLSGYVNEFGRDVFTTDGTILLCKICNIKVAAEKKFSIQQHTSREKHINGLNLMKKKNEKPQQLLNNVLNNDKTNIFNKELCMAMLSANIPFNKLKNKVLSNFLEKHTDKKMPDESTLRKNYVDKCFNETINSIRKYVENKKIWVSIDETSDVEGRYVANVIVGTLEISEPGKSFLLNCEVLEKANNSTITKLFDRSMGIIWPNGVKHDNVLLFVSDAAPYMVKAGKNIKALYSKMEHVTCLAHGLHRVAEEVREHFPKVDALISNVKKIFLKAPSRVLKFKCMGPTIPLPPQPILTRWGTWLEASVYYCEYFQFIKTVIDGFEENDAIAIKKAQHLMADKEIEANLIFIKSNYGNIPSCITRLEASDIPLVEAIGIVNNAKTCILNNTSSYGDAIKKKLEVVLNKNNGYTVMETISSILEGNETALKNIPGELTPDDICHFKYAPITSVDVERSFSTYKNILSDNRRSLVFENIKQYIIVQCNAEHCIGKIA